MGIINNILDKLDLILFEEKCISCAKSGSIFCSECLQYLQSPEHDLPEYIYSLYEYRNKYVKKLLTDAKYRKRHSGLKFFGNVMADYIKEITNEETELQNYTNVFIIPVPISKNRLKERGFNQSEIIVSEIFRYLNKGNYLYGNNIIYKIKDKTPQASIHSRQERINSPKGTFKINSEHKLHEKLKGSLCIVVDDITTTGGTISEMRRILTESGAAKCIGLTIAH